MVAADNNIFVEKIGSLFMKFGIKSITMDDVARELGISKKTLYQIVSDKKGLVEYIFNADLNSFKLKAESLKKNSDDVVLEMINILYLIFDLISNLSLAANYDLRKYHGDIYQTIKEKHFSLMHELVVQNLIRGKQEKVYRNEINENVLSKIYISQIEQIPYSEMIPFETFKTKEFSTELIRFILNGTVNEKGRNLLKKYEIN